MKSKAYIEKLIWIMVLVMPLMHFQVSGYQQVPRQAYDISEARQAGDDQKLIISGQELNARALLFNVDGTKAFIGGGNKEVHEYNLTTAYDLSTASYAGDTEKLALSNLTNNLADLAFNNDGTKLFTLDDPNGKVLEYTLASAYDVSTATFNGIGESLDLIPFDNMTRAMGFNSTGTKLFVAGEANGFIHEFDLGTAWDVSTASHSGNSQRFEYTSFTSTLQSIAFNNDGSKLFVNGSDKLIEFDLSTAYDISAAVHAGGDEEFVYDQGNVASVRFSPDGLQFFTLIFNVHGLWGYEVGPFDEVPPQVASITRSDPNPVSSSTVSWEVLFNEDVMGVTLADFELAFTGGLTGALSSIVAVDAETYTVSANGLANSGTVRLNLKDDDSIVDFGGNPLGGSGVGNGDFTGEVYFTNQLPTDITISSSVISENNAQNDLVGTLSTVDPDTGDSHNYTLVAGSGDADNASFLIVSDLLLAADLFDFEAKNSYSIRVRTTDSNGASFEKEIAIAISDANDVPSRINLSNASINETDESGQLIGVLSTEDQDAGDTFTYQLVGGSGSFNNSMVTVTGEQVLTAVPLDFEEIQSLRIRIGVTDAGGATNERPFVITVQDVEIEPIRDFTQNSEGAKIKNFFSPNGDGSNDVWVIDEIEDNPDNTVKVYTQAGLLVYTAEGYRNNWGGTYKGTILPSGTYYYEINIRNGAKVITGFLTLMTDR